MEKYTTEKYIRQIMLFGEEGQEKLKRAKVLVVGAGGLGSPIST
jgi:adenylyltransferase/sulfurtransferase